MRLCGVVFLLATCSGTGGTQCGEGCSCLTVTTGSLFALAVTELCGDHATLLPQTTLQPYNPNGTQVCLNTTHGWVVSFSHQPEPSTKQLPPGGEGGGGGGGEPPSGWQITDDGVVVAESASDESTTVALFTECECEERLNAVATTCTTATNCAVPTPQGACCAALYTWAVHGDCNASVGSVWGEGDGCAYVPGSLEDFIAMQCAGCYEIQFESAAFDVAECNGTRLWSAQQSTTVVACSAHTGVKVCSEGAWTAREVEGGEEVWSDDGSGNSVQWVECAYYDPFTPLCGSSVVIDGNVLLPDTAELSSKALPISSLPSQIALLSSLTSLDVEEIGMSAVPSQIGLLSALRRLSLRSNRIAVLPSQLGVLSLLDTVMLDDNELTWIPTELANIAHLTLLHCINNQVRAIPSQLGRLTDLTYLSFDGNAIEVVPSELGLLTSIESLKIERNQLSSHVSDLWFLGSLGQTSDRDIAVSLAQNYLVGCVWDEPWHLPGMLFVTNCMTPRHCANSTLQRSELDCMAIALAHAPPTTTNASTVRVQVTELLPHYRRYALSANNSHAKWVWTVRRPAGEEEEVVTGVADSELVVTCDEEGSYTLTVGVVMYYHDIGVCQQQYQALFSDQTSVNCTQATDSCAINRVTEVTCTMDDVAGPTKVVSWTVDTTPPLVAISAVLLASPSTVRDGTTVLPGASALLTIATPEDTTFFPSRAQLSGCTTHSGFVVVGPRMVSVECYNVSSGVTAVLVVGEGALRDAAGNENAPETFSFTAECGEGQAIVDGTDQCENVPCPENTVGYPRCRCGEGFEGTVEWRSTEQRYAAECIQCADGYWSDSSVSAQCGLTNAVSCTECAVCGFPRVVERKCSREEDTECSTVAVGLAPLYGSLGLGAATVYLVFRTNTLAPLRLARLALYTSLGFADLASDCYFIMFDASGVTKQLSILFLVVPVAANFVCTALVLRRALVLLRRRFVPRIKGQPTFSDALRESTKMYAVVILACCFNPRLLSALLHDFLPQAQHWHEPNVLKMYRKFIRSLQFAALTPSVLQDLPQLVIQSIAVASGTTTFSAVLSLTCTVLSILFEAVLVMVVVMAWSKAPKGTHASPIVFSIDAGEDDEDVLGAGGSVELQPAASEPKEPSA